MSTTPQNLTREFQDKRLRVEFTDGQIAEIRVLLVSECNQHAECNGIVCDIISTDPSTALKPGSPYWAGIMAVKAFEILGD
jgi:DUF971 family protein